MRTTNSIRKGLESKRSSKNNRAADCTVECTTRPDFSWSAIKASDDWLMPLEMAILANCCMKSSLLAGSLEYRMNSKADRSRWK